MSSLKLAFILCLFLATFDVFSSQSGDGLDMAGADKYSNGSRPDSQCDLWSQDLSSEYKNYNITECQCEVDTTEKKITDCFKTAACKRGCEKGVRESRQSVERCGNIVNNSSDFCERKCEDSSAFSVQSIKHTEEFKTCIDNQREQHLQACETHIANKKGPKGAQLVCENDEGCGSFCNTVVDTMMSNEYCGDNIANNEGFSKCNDVVSSKLRASLLDSSRLPPGLSWQKCSYEMPCASEIKMAFHQAEQECNNLKSKATICCEDPLKCAEAGSSDLFKSAGPVAGGITENCQRVQERLKNVGSATQQMAEKCKSMASSCVQVCTQQISENFLSTFNKYCNFDLTREQAYDRNKHTCEGDLISDYVNAYTEKLASIPGQCELTGQKSEQLKQSAEEILRSSASAQKCAEQASAGKSEIQKPSQTEEKPIQMAVLGPDTPNVKMPLPRDTSLRWNPGKADKGKENIVSGASAGGSSKKVSGRAAGKNPVRRANIAARKAPPTLPAKKKKGFLSKLLSAFGGSKKNREKQKEGATVGGGPQAASGKANVGGGGSAPATTTQRGLSKKDRAKADKKSVKYSTRQFTKTGSAKALAQKTGSVLDRGITPRDITSTRLGKYGSPHDNIFERLSHRIISLCRQKRINDCHL